MTDKNSRLTEVDLSQFTGTTQWYIHPLYRDYTFTDGVHHVIEHGQAFWLVSDILMYHKTVQELNKYSQTYWTLEKHKGGNAATLKCEDGDLNEIFSVVYPYTDFPIDRIDLWLHHNVLLLKSEY